MKKILIITKEQFGYLTDTYKYCMNLCKEFDITYICLDQNKPRIVCEDINILYVNKRNNINLSYYALSKYALKHLLIDRNDYDVIFCVFFRFCFLIPIFYKKDKIMMDIRTGSVNVSKIKNQIGNLEIKFNSIFFKNITVISESLALKLNLKKYSILPLGATQMTIKKEINKEMNLLYIGTFNNRKIEDSIVGYREYLTKKRSCIPTKYTIIGDGTEQVVKRLHSIIEKYELNDKVSIVGRVNHSDLERYLDSHNIGVSYIPITDYYDVQPPTKTYEYLMNGLICIATETSENKKIISENNGVLCKDDPISFAESLTKVESDLAKYEVNCIVESVRENSWENISSNIFLAQLNNVSRGKLSVR